MIDFTSEKSMRTADINTVKNFINSIVSTPIFKAVFVDVKNIYSVFQWTTCLNTNIWKYKWV